MEPERIKILAIDDNQDNLISLKALINEAFPEAILLMALNGTTGFDLAVTENPAVILLDIVMPDMDGFEVCRNLKADEGLRDIPVVFVTSLKGDKESRIQALECGAEAFLAKPIDEIELTAQIRAMLKIRTSNLEKCNEKSRLAALVAEQTYELKRTHTATLNLLEDLKNEIEARNISETERKRSESEKHILEQQFQQAQKLESLGVLAGGIAHDFNNILTVIICNCSLLRKRPQRAEELVQEIEIAAQRAADLCRQMLIYAGKAQPVPTKFNMAALVEEMIRMLKATISQ
ncbi:MAG: response regulator, partial [Pedobacter sp.]